MEHLPSEIALDILSRLPITSLMQTKCVCKAWLALTRDPRLPGMFYAQSYKRNPGLILHCDSPIVNSLYFVSSEEKPNNYNKKVMRIIPPFISNMPEYQLVGSCNGLLCISDALYFDPIYICNIFTGDHIELTKTSQHQEQDLALGFGFSPTTSEYKVVRVVYYHRHHGRGCDKHSDVQIYTIGRGSWRSLGSIRWRLDLRPSEALLNGNLHWVTRRYIFRPGPRLRIIAFDLAQEKFNEIERPACGSLDICNFHLVALRGCLSAVVCQNDGVEIWVMQVYNAKESWTKDFVIRANVPASLNQSARPESRIWKNSTLGKGAIQVVCILCNGEILLNYQERTLVSYSPENEGFKELIFSGLPRWFSAIIHVETLFSVEKVLRM